MKINFIYSPMLDEQVAKTAFTQDAGSERASGLEELWESRGKDIENVFKKFSGLEFLKKEIDCYVVGKGAVNMSLPLIVSGRDENEVFDNLIHELIHELFSQNFENKEEFAEKWKVFQRRYKDYDSMTRNHIPVHALHYVVAREVTPDRIENIKSYITKPAYQKSWEIVEEEGAETILGEINLK